MSYNVKSIQKKAPDYDLITGKILKDLRAITNLQCHSTNQIFPLSVDTGTNHNDCKTRKEPE